MNISYDEMKNTKMSQLNTFYNEDNQFEIGVDEAGRGPLFGRLYIGAVVLPKNNDFHHEWMKDSKKFHSKPKMISQSNLTLTLTLTVYQSFLLVMNRKTKKS